MSPQPSSTARSAAPHIVIRGETPYRAETYVQSCNQSQIAHIDWLAFSFNPPTEAKANPIGWLLPQLFAVFGIPPVTVASTGRGWNGYTDKLNIGDNAQYGLIAHGGEKQRGTVHVELNASACLHVTDWQKAQHWCESIGARITRVDLAHDDMDAETVSVEIAKAWYEAGEFTSNGRPPAAKLVDDMGSGKGKTLYIGNRANGKLLRVYEKGRQLGAPSSPWVRVELELHNKSRIVPWEVLTSPSAYLAGGYPCLAFLSSAQNKIRTITKAVEVTLESLLQYLRTVGGKAVNVLMQVHGGDTAKIVKMIQRDGIPRRLCNYADFMPQVVDEMGWAT